MRTVLALALALAASALAAPVPKALKVKTDAERFEGRWEGVSIEGEHGPQPYTMFLLVAGGKIGMNEKNDNSLVADQPITMTDSTSPSGFDVTWSWADKPTRNIFKVDGDLLYLCNTFYGGPRPTEFKPDTRVGQYLFVYRRVKE